MFKRLFSRKPRIFYIEIDDLAINNKISHLLRELHQQLDDFQKSIMAESIDHKENILLSLHKIVARIKKDLQRIHEDMESIQNIEVHHEDFFTIKDKSFLEDKKKQLAKIDESLTDFLMIVTQRPSKEALKEELLQTLSAQVDAIKQRTKRIIADDIYLREMYKHIKDL